MVQLTIKGKVNCILLPRPGNLGGRTQQLQFWRGRRCRRLLELGHCESRTWLCTRRHGQLIQVTSEIRVDLPWRVEQLSLIMGSRLPYLSSFPQISLWSHCRSLESFSSTSVLSFREPYLPGSYSIAYTWSKRVTQTLILWSGFHVLRISIGSP